MNGNRFPSPLDLRTKLHNRKRRHDPQKYFGNNNHNGPWDNQMEFVSNPVPDFQSGNSNYNNNFMGPPQPQFRVPNPAYSRRQGAIAHQQQHHQQQFPNLNVRFNNNYNHHRNRQIRLYSEEEPTNFGSEVDFNNEGINRGAMSVRLPNEDDFPGSYNNDIFSRRRYCTDDAPTPVPPPSRSAMTNDRARDDNPVSAKVFDYHHQRQLGSPKKAPRDYSAPPNLPASNDPRIRKLIDRQLKAEPSELSCERPGAQIVKCEHPRPNLYVKREKAADVGPRPMVELPAASSSRNQHPLHLDRIEREKYEKSKLRKIGERAVDSVRPIPRPPRDPELETELNVVIEKLNVPVITTPANFNNYKIPRKTSNPSAGEVELEPKNKGPAVVLAKETKTVAKTKERQNGDLVTSSSVAGDMKASKDSASACKGVTAKTIVNKEGASSGTVSNPVQVQISTEVACEVQSRFKRDSASERPSADGAAKSVLEEKKTTKDDDNKSSRRRGRSRDRGRDKRSRSGGERPEKDKQSQKSERSSRTKSVSEDKQRSRTRRGRPRTVDNKEKRVRVSSEDEATKFEAKKVRECKMNSVKVVVEDLLSKRIAEKRLSSEDEKLSVIRSRLKNKSEEPLSECDASNEAADNVAEEQSNEIVQPESHDTSKSSKVVAAAVAEEKPDVEQDVSRLDIKLVEFLRTVGYEEFKKIQNLLPNEPSEAAKVLSKEIEKAAVGPPVSPGPQSTQDALPRATLMIEIPKTQSPTISSCERFDSFPSPIQPSVNLHDLRGDSEMQNLFSRPLKASRQFERAQSNSPKTRRKRKSSLEKLQEDNSRNYLATELYMSRRNRPKDPPVKKIVQRRKSLCASLNTDNGAIKLTISRDSLPPQKITRRRMTVGCSFVPSEPEKECILNDDVFHDNWADNCKLCTKLGCDMKSHYIDCHPESEVFNSRIKYAKALKLKEGVPVNVLVDPESLEYECLICEMMLSCSTYYEMYKHLVNHTGEHYFKCIECPFRDATHNNNHAKDHRFEIFPFAEIANNRITGYMCQKCHYVQLHKSNVYTHILANHPEDCSNLKCLEVTLVDFGELNILILDFEDPDRRFTDLLVVEKEENWSQLGELFREYLSEDAASNDEEDEEEQLERSFDLEVQRLMAPVQELQTRPRSKRLIKIESLEFECDTENFVYRSSEGTMRNSSFKKMKTFLEEKGGEWSGFCEACDEYNIYAEPQSASSELLHLRNVHWYQTVQPQQDSQDSEAISRGGVLRPWLTKQCSKTAEECEKMLSVTAILSTFKCMATNCQFYTNNMDIMTNHLEEHEADPLSDVDDMIGCCYCEKELGSPDDYLKHMLEHSSWQYICPYCFYRSNHINALNHVRIYHPDRRPFIFDGKFNGFYSPKEQSQEDYNNHLLSNLHRNVRPHQCPYCVEKFFPIDVFQQHLEEHGPEYYCTVCSETVPVLQFLPHITKHNEGPFTCIFCEYAAIDGRNIKKHHADKHPDQETLTCVRFFKGKGDYDNIVSVGLCFPGAVEEQFVKIVPREQFDEIESHLLISNVQGGVDDVDVLDKEENQTEHEWIDRTIETLPKACIFDKAVSCPKCKYSSSVRTNYIHHLSMHKDDSGATDQENQPVHQEAINPPETAHGKRVLSDQNSIEEQVFGKPIKRTRRMTISEISSTNERVPQYVPLMQRFVCGVARCDYVGLEERMLRCHMDVVHARDQYFKCPHCDKVLAGSDFQIEMVASHYKLHDSQLFKCAACDFYGDTRHNVSKHMHKRHIGPWNEESVVEVRCKDATRKPISSAKPAPKSILKRRNSVSAAKHAAASTPKRTRKEKPSYRCSHCTFESEILEEMNGHNLFVHENPEQFQCADCGAFQKTKAGFLSHVRFNHAGYTPEMIIHFKAVTDVRAEDTSNLFIATNRPRTPQPSKPTTQTAKSVPRASTTIAQPVKIVPLPTSQTAKSVPRASASTPLPVVVTPQATKPTSHTVTRAPQGTKSTPQGTTTTAPAAAKASPATTKSTQATSATPQPTVDLCEDSSKSPADNDGQSCISFEAGLVSHFKQEPGYRPLVYYCHVCSQTFNEWEPAYEHYKRTHNTTLNPTLPRFLIYSCLLCEFHTPRDATLVQHFKTAHRGMAPVFGLEYLVKCLRCDFANTAENVVKHYATAHRNERPLVQNMLQKSCGQCAFQFQTEDDLRPHFEKAHKKIINQPLKLNEALIKSLLDIKFDKTFKCRDCKELLNNYQCRFHVHGQASIVPVETSHLYKCPICKCFFTADYQLAAKHMNGHKGEKTRCDRCKEPVASYDALLKHLAVHRQVEPYKKELFKRYSVEVLFPNGLTVSESQLAGALDGYHYRCKKVTGKEV